MKALAPYSFPLILGNDLAGDVEAVGPGVSKFEVGDAIYSRRRITRCARALSPLDFAVWS